MIAPIAPFSVAASTSSRIRFLYSAVKLRRRGLAGTSESTALAKERAVLLSFTMKLLCALLCNYGRGKCLIDVGTEGQRDVRPRLLKSVTSILRLAMRTN